MLFPDELDIEYLPITPTLTKIRVRNKNLLPQREILCYPITNVTKPIDLFAPFPKSAHTFVPVSPPNPPLRVSSKENSTLKVYSGAKNHEKKSESKPSTVNTGTITLRKSRLPSTSSSSGRARSAGSLITSSFKSLKDEKNFANNSRIAKQYVQRVSSLSPVGRKIESRKANSSPIAFGRSISKERTFAEEKKKQEERLPLCKRAWTASTNILRDPFLNSPKEVREAVRNTYQSPQTKERITSITSTRKIANGNLLKSSTVTYAKDKLLKNSIKNDERTLRLCNVVSQRGNSVPVVVKSNLSRSAVSTETKMNPRSKQTTKTSSSVSLARTNSTFSIDSSSSKRRIRNRPLTIKSATKSIGHTVAPVTISSKIRKKKPDDKVPTTISSAPKSNQVQTKEIIDVKRTISPSRKGYERSNSFIMIKDKSQSKQPGQKQERHVPRSDKFFQQLFLRNIATGDQVVHENAAIQEKAQFWNTIPRRTSSVTKKRQSPSVYLSQKQAVTGSKFKALENDKLIRQSSTKSPRVITFDRVSKYDSFFQLSDESEFEEIGCSRYDYHYEERSKSEPRSITYTHQPKVASDNKKAALDSIEKLPKRPFSPTREIRSPSSRKIQSLRTQSKPETITSVVRVEGVDSHRRYHSLDSRLTKRRSCCIDADNYESHLELCSHRRSEKFKDLNRFYSTVERVGQLERTTSNIDLHPIRKENELIDFDVWKEVRSYERAERELNALVGKLKKDEKDKDFLFRPKYADDLKWNRNVESGLRVKERLVKDLKEFFNEKSLDHDDKRKNVTDLANDKYKSLWRGNSVLDLASSMVVKYNPPIKRNKSFHEDTSRLGISTNLISTLSKDQVSKIKNQLTEIYSHNGKSSHKVDDEYVINVYEEHNIRPTSLLVRSSSLVGEKELLKPVLQRQEERLKCSLKADSISNVHETRTSKSVDRYHSIERRQVYSEDEKKKLLQQLGNEICSKIKERQEKVLQPRETRGAIASEKSLKSAAAPPKADSKTTDVQPPQSVKRPRETRAPVKSIKSSISKEVIQASKPVPKPIVEMETHVKQTFTDKIGIAVNPNETVTNKIEYFEKKKDEEQPKTIYLPRDDSSPDEDEVIRVVSEKVKMRQKASAQKKPVDRSHLCSNGLSTSASDLKEIFGEKESVRNLIEIPSPSPSPIYHDIQSKNGSNATSIESFFRSRSISPICDSKHSTLKKPQYDSSKYQYDTYKPKRSRPMFAAPPRRYKSDPSLNDPIYRNQSPSKVIIKDHEAGDVTYITHKFEMKKMAAARERARSRRRITSPIQRVAFKSDDRFMPHIDIISKTVALKESIHRSRSPRSAHAIGAGYRTGEVEKIRHKFETQTSPDRISIIGQMYTSSPDISELKDISTYLSGTWTAHKYPKPIDNARSASEPDKEPASKELKLKKSLPRSNSTSPTRTKQQTIDEIAMLKPFHSVVDYHNFDPLKHRPTHRYIPIDKRIEAEFLWQRLKKQSIDANDKENALKTKSQG